MMKVKRINKEDVKPVKLLDEKQDPRPVAGASLFHEIYSNIFFCARKKSGKTSAISHILDRCATTETKVIAFVSTIYRDATWRAIAARLEKRKISFHGYTSLKDEATKEDILGNIVKTLEEQQDDEEDEQPEEEEKGLLSKLIECDDERLHTGIKKPKKPRRPKEQAPKIIFVFDDLSGELQSPSLTQLLKKNRHFKCKVIISSQYWNDISPQSRQQINVALLYKGLAQSLDKLQEIFKNLDPGVDFETFLALYRYATAKKFSFLYIDTVNSEFRKGFSHIIELPKEKDDEEILEL